jgi:hypothetical protein
MNASQLHADNPAADSTAVSDPALSNLWRALDVAGVKNRREALSKQPHEPFLYVKPSAAFLAWMRCYLCVQKRSLPRPGCGDRRLN